MREIQIFLEDYDRVVIEKNFQKISTHFYDQFTLSTPTDCWNIINNHEFLANLKKSFDRYKQLGAKICKMMAADIINFKSSHYLANVEWALLDDEDMPIVRFDISYLIKNIRNEWKFIFVIDHNEPK